MAEPENKDFETILAELLADAKIRMNKIKNWIVGGVIHSILAILSKGLEQLYITLFEGIGLAFLETSTGTWLRAIAALIGITPLVATKTRGTVIIGRIDTSSEKTVDIGKIVGTETSAAGVSYRYRVIETATAGIGTAEIEVKIEALNPGADYNIGSGLITKMYSTIQGFDYVKNDQPDNGWLTREGADDEYDDRLKARCRVRWAAFAYGGTADLYISTIMQLIEVQTVKVDSLIPRGLGTVDVIFTTTSKNGIPTQECLDAAQILIDASKPCESDILAKAPIPSPQNIYVILYQALTGGDKLTIQMEAVSAIQSLFLPTNSEMRFGIGDDLIRAKIAAKCIQVANVANVNIVIPSADIGIPSGGLATFGNLTVEVM